MTVLAAVLCTAASGLAASPASAKVAHWEVREAIGEEEFPVSEGEGLETEQLLEGGVDIRGWSGAPRTEVVDIFCSEPEYNGGRILGGEPGTLTFEEVRFGGCEALTQPSCVVEPIVMNDLTGETVFTPSTGAAIRFPAEFIISTSCASLFVHGDFLVSFAAYPTLAPLPLYQFCQISSCVYNENGTGTLRETRLTVSFFGPSLEELTMQAQFYQQLAPSSEPFDEFGIH